LNKGHSIRAIARQLNRSHSNILHEVKENSVEGVYDPRKADQKAYVRRKYARYQGMRITQNSKLQDYVETELYDNQSPGAIAGRLKKKPLKLRYASKDTIYRYIKSPYGRKVEHHREKQRKKRKRRKSRTKPWKDRIFINMRPNIINNRRRVGDAEADFIVSGKSGRGILLVVVDRKTRVTFIERIIKPSTGAVTKACRSIKRRYPEWRSMTADNDILFQHHQELAQKLSIKIYFCFPGHAWEKGQVENTNRYIRRYIPKSSNISRYSSRYVKDVEAWLNRRFIKILDYATPQEKINKQRKHKKRRIA
jgi:transposase, IS30 family